MANWLFYNLIAGGLYAIGGLLFLLWVRLDKDENGEPFLNPKSLHYKITGPMLSRREKKRGTVNICSYYLRFVFMLFVGWLVVFVFQAVKTIAYAPFMFLFGHYPIPTLESMKSACSDECNILAVDIGEIPLPRISLPRFGNVRLLPIYILLPIGYVCLFFLFDASSIITLTLICALILGLFFLLDWFNYTDNATVGLTREFLSSKKKKLCVILPIKEKGENQVRL